MWFWMQVFCWIKFVAVPGWFSDAEDTLLMMFCSQSSSERSKTLNPVSSGSKQFVNNAFALGIASSGPKVTHFWIGNWFSLKWNGWNLIHNWTKTDWKNWNWIQLKQCAFEFPAPGDNYELDRQTVRWRGTLSQSKMHFLHSLTISWMVAEFKDGFSRVSPEEADVLWFFVASAGVEWPNGHSPILLTHGHDGAVSLGWAPRQRHHRGGVVQLDSRKVWSLNQRWQ